MTRRRIAGLIAFNAAAVLLVAALVSLAVWQMHRRAWKLDLIARIEARVHVAPAPAPSRDHWHNVIAVADEYRRVTVSGHWHAARPSLAKAVTERGGGYWVMSPFACDDGTTILINRGFVPIGKTFASADFSEETSVTGKLRLSEPGGGFLRANDPASDRWFSRDVAAIAAARELADVAPYFIDAEGPAAPDVLPVPGLTVLSFSNNHLIYALTWATLAAMAFTAALFINFDILRKGRRVVRGPVGRNPA